MCGIAGYVDLGGGPVGASTLKGMLRWLHHRGPDDSGTWCDGPVGIGTERLAIIDVAGGHQPIPNEDESVWVALNGEIYNFDDLGAELRRAGHAFRTRTDTEVVVHAYEEWGEQCFARLKGMFGLAVVDRARGRLYLARDVAGEKPLFYCRTPSFFAFASEIKAILQELPVGRQLNPLAAQSFFAFGRPVGDLSIYREVEKLRPGHVLRLDLVTGVADVWPFWSPPAERLRLTPAEAEEELDRLLDEAVRRTMVADVPVGAFLSGGVDSSLVVSRMGRFAGGPVRTYTAMFDDARMSEAADARRIAGLLGTDHHEVEVRPGDVAGALPRLVWHMEEPFGDASMVLASAVAGRAREDVTVALTGDGGDELFGGYDWYLALRATDYLSRMPAPALDAAASLIGAAGRVGGVRGTRAHKAADRITTASGAGDDLDRLFAVMGDGGGDNLVDAATRSSLLALRRSYADLSSASGLVERAMLFQFQSLLPELFFTKVDRTSMAHSLEARSPLVYRDVLEFALRLPAHLKVRGITRKFLPKRLAARVLPRDIVYRRKRGFSAPFYRWLREDPALRSWVSYFGTGDRARAMAEAAGVDPGALVARVESYLAGAHDRWVVPWKAVCFGLWWETFVEHDGRQPVAPDAIPALVRPA